MAGGVARTGGGKKGALTPNSEPNVIPFIDIMLVLLIIFMVASPPPTVDIRVDLPPPGQPIQRQSDDRPTFVALEDNGGVLTYRLAGNEVRLELLGDQLLNVARLNNPSMRGDDVKLFAEAKIYVQADQETQYSNVVTLMNEVDRAGFKKVSLVAEEAQF